MPCANHSGVGDELIRQRHAECELDDLKGNVKEMDNRVSLHLNKLQINLDKESRILCYVLNNLDENNKENVFNGEYGDETKKWFDDHTDFDKKRLLFKIERLGLDKSEINILRQILNEGYIDNESNDKS